jgi:Spy/CpxP family protein refolding chaperone
MKRRLLLIALVASLGLNAGGLGVFAYHKWLHPRRHGGPATALAELNLTAAQEKEIAAVRGRAEARIHPLLTQLMTKRLELIRLLKADAVDAGRRDALLAEIAALQTEIEICFMDSLFETKRVLTPVQREAFVAALEKGVQEKRPPFGASPAKSR